MGYYPSSYVVGCGCVHVLGVVLVVANRVRVVVWSVLVVCCSAMGSFRLSSSLRVVVLLILFRVEV
jgi:hypothetical protein